MAGVEQAAQRGQAVQRRVVQAGPELGVQHLHLVGEGAGVEAGVAKQVDQSSEACLGGFDRKVEPIDERS